MTRFFDEEVIDLIDEVGHYLEFAVREQTAEGDPDNAVPPTYRFTTRRRVKGYVTQKDMAVPLGNGESRFGLIEAYILGSEIDMNAFTNNSMLLYEGKSYQIQYMQDIRSQGRLVLHKLMLVPAQEYKTINQQDGVIRAAELEPTLEEIPPWGSPASPALPATPELPAVPVPFAPH